jgi:integrase
VLQSIMRKAILDEQIEYNPVAVVRKPKQRRKREPLKIPPETVELIRSKLNMRDATLVSVLAYTGVRPESERVTLTWDKIGDQTICIVHQTAGTAGGRPSRVEGAGRTCRARVPDIQGRGLDTRRLEELETPRMASRC